MRRHREVDVDPTHLQRSFVQHPKEQADDSREADQTSPLCIQGQAQHLPKKRISYDKQTR